MQHLVIGISNYNNINKLTKSTTLYVIHKKNKKNRWRGADSRQYYKGAGTSVMQ
ncbi:hypothetical protein [Sporomusa sp. GT1]|uniref:hypothetical protein n=1 Tax=Sporomusa sp. GT1 TaxID=1534747 RepID=UPI001CB80439|nr:hypothetical protein [Sporomusa sp. GT1]